jgi:uncharacterized protein YhjY with autotransporter beta-barrel domain
MVSVARFVQRLVAAVVQAGGRVALLGIVVGALGLSAAAAQATTLTATLAVPSTSLTFAATATPFTPVTVTGGLAPVTFAVAPALPAGLTFSTSTGQISGAPTIVSPAANYTVTVSDSTTPVAQTATKVFTLAVAPTTSLTTTTNVGNVTLTAGSSANVTPVTEAGGVGIVAFAVSPALPSGLNFLSSTGAITGAAANASALGVYAVTVTALNGLIVQQSSTNFSLTVNPPLVATAASPTLALTAGAAAFAQPVTATGGSGAKSFAVSPALPAGLSFSTSNGRISGTPTTAAAGTPYTITVSDSSTPPAQASAHFSLSINGPLAIGTSLANVGLTVGSAASVTPVTATGGANPLTYTIQPSLPAGLSFSATTGQITGTPAVSATSATFNVSINDASTPVPQTKNQSFTLVINPALAASVAVPTSALTTGTAVTPFTPVTTTGGTGAVVFAVQPALPTGLILNTATGQITGTPTAAAVSTIYTITATDQSTPTPQTASKTISLGVTAAALSAVTAVPTTSLSTNVAVTPFTPVTAAGGSGAIAYSVSPALPTGLSFSTTSGQISGTPTVVLGVTTFTVAVSDHSSPVQHASRTFSLSVLEPTLTATQRAPTTVLTAGVAVTPFTPVSGAGGLGALHYAVTPVLPAGLSMSSTTGQITGSPSVLLPTTVYTVTVTDQTTPNGPNASNLFRLTINAGTLTSVQAVASTTLTTGVAAAVFTPVTASGGFGTITYSVAPALPTGLAFSTVNGQITGTPSAPQAATSYIVTAKDVTTPLAQTSAKSFSIAVNSIPVVTLNPVGQTAAPGASVILTAGASGFPAPTVKWQRQAPSTTGFQDVSGAVATTLTLSNVGVADSGSQYRAVFTNVAGSASTSAATLQVSAQAPVITSFSPTAVASIGGAALTITGGALTGASVTIDGVSAPVSSGGAGSLIVTVPALSTGSKAIVVTTAGGTTTAPTLLSVRAALATTVQTPTAALTVGTAVTVFAPITATSGFGPISYAISPALPSGLAFSASTGQISGQPVAPLAATPYTVTATDSQSPAPATSAKSFSLIIYGPPATAASSATVAYGVTSAPIALAISGASATSLTLVTLTSHGVASVSGATITYTPAAGYFGPDSLSYTATGTGGTSSPATVSITVSAPVISITTASLSSGQVGTAYSASLSATGGAAPISFALQSGSSMPSGLALSASGAISGTPTASGGFTFTVVATDSSTGAGPARQTRTYALQIAPAVIPVATSKVVVITRGAGGTVSIDLSGSVSNAVGISVTVQPQHGTATVLGFVVTYTPNPGYYGPDAFTYVAVGPSSGSSGALHAPSGGASSGQSAADTPVSDPALVSLTFTAPTVVIDSSALAPAASGASYTRTFIASGGTAPYAYAIAGGVLPPGVSLSRAGVLSGAPSAVGAYTFTVSATDSSTGAGPFVTSQTFTLQVASFTPVAPTLTIAVAADKIGTADVTSSATGGPFTGATVVSVSPANAGTASLALTSGTVGVNAAYALTFRPTLHYSGNAVVAYTLSNASATSTPASVTFQVAARADPTANPTVRGLLASLRDAAFRFAGAQLSNINQRLESLHSRGQGGNVNGVSFAFGNGPQQPGPDDSPARRNDMPAPSFGAAGLVDGSAGGASGSSTILHPLTPPTAFTSGSAGALARSAAAVQAGDHAGGAAPGTGAERLSVWTGGAVDFGSRSGDAGRAGLKFSTGGLSFGADYRFSDRFTFGVGGGYGQDDAKVGSDAAHDKATSYSAFAYGSYHPSPATYIDGVLGYADLSFDTRRYDDVNAETEYGKRKGGEVFASLTAAWEHHEGQALISPYARVDAVSGSLDAFTETGGLGALAYASQDVKSLKSVLGVHLDYLKVYPTAVWQPRVRLEYQHEFENAGAFTLQYADWLTGPVYRSALDPTGRDHLVFGIGTDIRAKDLTLSFDYKADFDSSQTVHELAAKLAWKF